MYIPNYIKIPPYLCGFMHINVSVALCGLNVLLKKHINSGFL